MPRKGENIYKRKDGRWEGRFIKNRDANNKISYGYLYGKTYQDVKERLLVVKAKHLEKTLIKSEKSYERLDSWIRECMTTKIKKEVKPSTYYNYSRLLKNHVFPAIGSIKMKDLTQKNVQTVIEMLREKQLAVGTVHLIYTILNSLLKIAVQEGCLSENPCHYVLLPKKPNKRVHALTIAEQKKMERLFFADPEGVSVILALYTGMRIGEICGLKWSDIDFETRLIHVQRTVMRVTDENALEKRTVVVEDHPKTAESNRFIPMTNHLCTYLLQLKESNRSNYIVNNQGKRVEPRTVNYRFKKVLAGTDLEKFHFHTLRHTFATRCVENGVDIASVSRLMGHSSIKLTLDTYTDSMMEKRREAVGTLDLLFEESYASVS